MLSSMINFPYLILGNNFMLLLRASGVTCLFLFNFGFNLLITGCEYFRTVLPSSRAPKKWRLVISRDRSSVTLFLKRPLFVAPISKHNSGERETNSESLKHKEHKLGTIYWHQDRFSCFLGLGNNFCSSFPELIFQ